MNRSAELGFVQKRFIVQRLACYDTPLAVVKAFKEEFGQGGHSRAAGNGVRVELRHAADAPDHGARATPADGCSGRAT